MKRTFPSSVFAFLITAILCDPAELFSSNKPETFLKQQSSKTGFIENKGQIIDQNNKPNPGVLYLLNTPGMNVQLRKGGFSYDLYSVSSRQSAVGSHALRVTRHDSIIQHPLSSINFHRVDLDLKDCNPDYTIETSGQSSDYLNYYTTGTPDEGITSVRSYSTVTYKNIYPGIDLQFISDDKVFEYNFILQPGADINLIKLKVYGPQKIKSFKEGLHCETTLGDVDETIPVCYYTMNDIRVPVKGRFKKLAEHLYGFSVDKVVPAEAVLLIDPIPTRRWGTYFGDAGFTQSGQGTIDNAGNCILTGYTYSTINIATFGAYQVILMGDYDAFLEKFSSGGQRIWGTYYGGTLPELGDGCTVDRFGDIIMVGNTLSHTNIATPGAYQTSIHKANDGFIAKFTSTGQRIWASYYGGNETQVNQDESIYNCCTDSSGNIYCAGRTTSPDFISSPGAHQPNYAGMTDCFLVKFTPSGQRVWGTYYGGSNEDYGRCTITKDGVLYLSGDTQSPDNIATPGSFLPTYNGFTKAFLAAFDTSGQRLWGTYYGGENFDRSYGCSADTNSNVYIYGVTYSQTNIATPGSFQQNQIADSNAFLAKFNSTGQRIWGTYYGAGWSSIGSVSVDDSGYVFLAGGCYIQNSVFAPPGAFQTVHRGSTDCFIAKFSSDGTQRIWGSYYGGMGYDNGWIAADHNHNFYLSGNTYSDNNSNPDTSLCTRQWWGNYIATPVSFQPELMYFSNVFLVKFSDCYSPDTAIQINGPSAICQNSSGNIYSIDPIPTATSYTWCTSGSLVITAGQGTTSVSVSAGSTPGKDTISVYGSNSCDNGYPKARRISVIPRPNPEIYGPDTTCTGINNIFTTAGGKSNYQWTVSPGGTITFSGTVTDSSCTVKWSIAGAHWVKVGYTDTTGCTSLNPTQFNVWVDPGLLTSVSISSSANPVCSGTSVTLTAYPVNEGSTPFYQWKVNGIDAGVNNASYTYTPVNGDIVVCQLTSSLTGCLSGNPATSNQILMTVNVNQPVSITISPDVNPVCSGTSVTFTAYPINGGATPSYQWKVNGTVAGTNSPTYSYIPVNGDLVTCILTSSEQCTSSNPASSIEYLMTVNPNLLVTVSIISSSNPFCAGSSVTFTATPNNGGSPPSYQWKGNGINAGTNSNTYTYNPVNNDQVLCILTSSELCTSNNPASSIIITMVENNSLPAGVSIAPSSNPFCPGSSVSFHATPSNGGPLPAYQWKVNGINAGVNSDTYSYNPANGDSVRCVMTSNLSCVTGNPASSTKIIMSGTLAPIVTFKSCFDTITTINAKPIRLKGGIPLGGTYSGAGVNSLTGVFNPAIAGVGTHTITYSYTNAAMCSATKSISILNLPSSILTCGNPLTDVRDNKVYQTIQIGSQCWLATNLNYGTTILSSQDQRDNCISEKYCYNDIPTNCTNHGGLYQWDELMQFDETPADQGFCPPGWHIPTENDWNILFATYINSGFAGSPLKYSGYSGFNALLSGARHINRGWDFQGFATFFWSSTPISNTKAWAHGMNDADPSVSLYPSSRVNAFSVRCLKD